MKATGAQIIAFYQDWPPGSSWYYDGDYDMQIEDEYGNLLLDPGQGYDLADFGELGWQGRGDPSTKAPVRGRCSVPFAEWFSAWCERGQRIFVLTLPDDDRVEQELLAFAAEHGFAVVRK